MTANADDSASFIGPSERMEITVVSGAKAADLSALAQADAKSIAASVPGFHQLSSPSNLTLGGYHLTKFSYAAQVRRGVGLPLPGCCGG